MSHHLGNRIRSLRESKGWRQEELAEKANMNREVLSNIENNRRHIKTEELNSFADIFEVSSDQLLGRIPLDEIHLSNNYPIQKVKKAMRISVPAKHVQKFREVLLYILNKVGAKSNVDETVIYKLLYFIDFDFYEKYEEQLIGATYKKNRFGPTPIEFEAIVDSMISDKEIEKIKSAYYQKKQKKYLPLRKPNIDCLSARELRLIDQVLSRLSDKNASQISAHSHGDIPWKVTDDGEVIDYETVFYRTSEYSVRDYGSE